MADRKQPTMAEKLASALLELQRLRGDPIPREHAKLMHAEQICSLFEYDHDAGYACDGADNHPTKLTPLLRSEHKEKTAKIDIPAIAKGKRIRRKRNAHEVALKAKYAAEPINDYWELVVKKARSRKMQSRPFPAVHRKMHPTGNKLRGAGFRRDYRKGNPGSG